MTTGDAIGAGLWGAPVVSRSWMRAVAAGWLMFEPTGSAVAVGVLRVLGRAPGIFAAYGGALVDRSGATS
jgi:hypothetical protein